MCTVLVPKNPSLPTSFHNTCCNHKEVFYRGLVLHSNTQCFWRNHCVLSFCYKDDRILTVSVFSLQCWRSGLCKTTRSGIWIYQYSNDGILSISSFVRTIFLRNKKIIIKARTRCGFLLFLSFIFYKGQLSTFLNLSFIKINSTI